jgi:FlaA1/EpsC-like NDP-sugar epimerase
VLVAQLLRVLIDVILLVCSLGLAFALRFDWNIPDDMLGRLFTVTPCVVLLQYMALATFRAPRISWRFFSLRDLKPFIYAYAASGAVLVGLRYGIPKLLPNHPLAPGLLVPFSVILLDAGIALGLTLAARAVRRAVSEDAEKSVRVARSIPPGRSARTLLIGAGHGGVITARELVRRPELGIVPIGFVDDDTAKVGLVICGLPVFGTTTTLRATAQRYGAEEALITIANARGPSIRRLTALCEEAKLPVRIVPGIHEIVGGVVNLSAIREVAIDDLLGRNPIRLDESSLTQSLEGREVLVTGAGGSIGSELCRQIARFRPAKLLLVDSSENNLFNIHRELVATHTRIELVPMVGSVTDSVRMREIFSRMRPEVILHAAAYKHVPMMELNPAQAVINNSLGTRIVADLAHEFGAREFVLVSTDKAVRPSSVMGATKRAAEVYVQALATRSMTRFITVRFGNVLGSAGSVVPIFKEQIAKGGPVTITDPRMTRYFMTIPEACQLILQAALLGQGGEIFMLDMGEPVKIVDLARDLISLSGFTPEVDIEIVVSGIRPGEKLTEELWSQSEGIVSTEHPSIFVGTSPPREFAHVHAWYQRLETLRDQPDGEWARGALSELLPEATLLVDSGAVKAERGEQAPSLELPRASSLIAT